MIPISKLIEEIERAAKAATPVVGWYLHRHERQIRGPWQRWIQVTGPEQRHPEGRHASIEEDLEYFRMCIREMPRLLAYTRRLEEAAEKTAKLLTWQCEGPYGNSPFTATEVLRFVRSALRDPKGDT